MAWYLEWRRVCFYAWVAVCAFFSIKLLAYHGWLVSFPWPTQTREAAIMLTTDLLLHGGNPYRLDLQPVYTNVYGILYNLCVYPLARLWGPTILVHMAVSGLFLLGCCGLFYAILRRAGIARLYAWAGVLLLYASLLMRLTPLIGPDTLGLLLFLLTVFLPWLRGFSWPSLLLSALCGVACFYTKLYFVAGVLCLGSFVFCFVSVKRALLYGLGFALLFLLLAGAMESTCGVYFDNVLVSLKFNTGHDSHYLYRQLKAILVYYRELLALLAVALLYGLPRLAAALRARPEEAGWSRWRGAVPAEAALPVYGLGFMLLVFCGVLGGHDGAWLTYFFQLVTPFFLLVLLLVLRNDRRTYLVNLVLLAASLFFTTRGLVRQPTAHFATQENWTRIQALVGSHTNILAAPPVAPLLLAQGRPVYDSGHSEYFFSVQARHTRLSPWLEARLAPVRERNAAYLAQIAADIRAKRFDLLLLNDVLSAWLLPPPAVLTAYYDHKATVPLGMVHSGFVWAIDIWEPKP